MLSKPPSASPATTFSLSGNRQVRLARSLPCPHCGRELRASDVVIGANHTALICDGCHQDVVTIEQVSR